MICRTFRSGGTRIRTGDTMIFSHMQKPLGMRQIRIGKRIYVHGVPLDTTWFCPYCCATVDTSFRYSNRSANADPPRSLGLANAAWHQYDLLLPQYVSCQVHLYSGAIYSSGGFARLVTRVLSGSLVLPR